MAARARQGVFPDGGALLRPDVIARQRGAAAAVGDAPPPHTNNINTSAARPTTTGALPTRTPLPTPTAGPPRSLRQAAN